MRGIELAVGPGAGAAVAAHRKAPVQLAHQADFGGVEPGRDPCRSVRVAAVLAQHVAHVPQRAERCAGRRLAACAGVQRPTLGAQGGHGAAEEFIHPSQARGFVAQDAPELGNGTVGACRADGGGIGAAPAEGHAGDDDLGVEHGERSGHHLTRHLAHQRTAAGEVGGPVGQGNPAGRVGTGVEAECHIVGVAFRREIHLADHRLEH